MRLHGTRARGRRRRRGLLGLLLLRLRCRERRQDALLYEVSVSVGFEFVLSAERFAASGALEGFLSGVSAPVTTQMGGPGESGGAEVAGKGPIGGHVRGLQVDPECVC